MSPCAELLWPAFAAASSGVSPLDVFASTLPPSLIASETAALSFLSTASSSGALPQAARPREMIAASSRTLLFTLAPFLLVGRFRGCRKQPGFHDHAGHRMVQHGLQPAAGVEQRRKVHTGLAAH